MLTHTKLVSNVIYIYKLVSNAIYIYSGMSNERISLASYRFSGEALRRIKERVGGKSSTIGNHIGISTVEKHIHQTKQIY